MHEPVPHRSQSPHPFHRTLTRRAVAVLATTVLVGVAAAQDDRELDTPTGAIWLTGQTIAQLTTQVNAGWRITDLEYDSTVSQTFTAALVRNTGSYAKTWWWYAGVTANELSTFVNAHNGRLTDLEPYDDNGTTRFAAVMVRNSGADAKTWWWYADATSTAINSAVSANQARLVDLERYTKGGNDRFAGIMIRNTGADARNWSYYYGVTSAGMSTLLNQHNLRPYSISRTGSGTYDFIGVQNSGIAHWYYFGLSSARVTEVLEQHVGRLMDVERYRNIISGVRYDVVVIDNANDLERRARQHFDGTDGAYGAWLKQIDGPVMAQIRPDFQFEPASLMKTLYHAHALRRVGLRLDSLNSSVSVPLATTGSCPNNSGSSVNETLEVVLRKMMKNSDNNRTLAIANRYGVTNINNTAATLGMSQTSVNHVIGCGGPVPNQTTLRDVSRVHEEVANGYVLNQREKFYELMPNTLAFPTWGASNLSTRIDAEAASLGLPSYVRDAFKSAVEIAYKPGGYGVNSRSFYSEGGFLSVPFKSANGIILRRGYAFGSFNHDASSSTPARNAVSNAALELVWDRVRAGLATWNNPFLGSMTSFGSSCAGTAGSPTHDSTGEPQIGLTVSYLLRSAPRGATGVLALGFSNSTWTGGRLPFSLTIIGATGCNLHIDPAVTESVVADSRGGATRSLPLPLDAALIGNSLYTQYLVLDRAANPAGLTSTNGRHTTVGGFR